MFESNWLLYNLGIKTLLWSFIIWSYFHWDECYKCNLSFIFFIIPFLVEEQHTKYLFWHIQQRIVVHTWSCEREYFYGQPSLIFHEQTFNQFHRNSALAITLLSLSFFFWLMLYSLWLLTNLVFITFQIWYLELFKFSIWQFLSTCYALTQVMQWEIVIFIYISFNRKRAN